MCFCFVLTISALRVHVMECIWRHQQRQGDVTGCDRTINCRDHLGTRWWRWYHFFDTQAPTQEQLDQLRSFTGQTLKQVRIG